MNVRQFIELLKTIEDQDAEVNVIEHTSGTGCYDQGGHAKEVLFNEKLHIEYTDLRGNPYTTDDKAYYNKRYLLIGAKDL